MKSYPEFIIPIIDINSTSISGFYCEIGVNQT